MLKTTKFLAVLPVLLSILPAAQACVGEEPRMSIQDLSTGLFAGGSVLSLALLGYMHMPKPARLSVNRFMAGTIMVLIGVLVVGLIATTVVPRLTSLAHQTTTVTTAQPIPMTPPVTAPLLVH